MENSTKSVPSEALISAISRLNDIAELLSDEGHDVAARSLVTTTTDLEWQLEELVTEDDHLITYSVAV